MEKPKSDGGRSMRGGGRDRRPRAERAGLVGEYRASGLTQEQFAAQAGINLGTLRGWIYKQRMAGGEAAGHFAPVRIVGGARSPSTTTRGSVTVRWPQGIEVELAVDLDGAAVERLVRELLGPCLR